MLWFLLPPPFRRSKSCKTVNEAHIKKAQAKSQLIFRKVWFLNQGPISMLPPQFGTSNGGTGMETTHYLTFSPNIAPADFVLYQREKLELAVLSLSQESLKRSCEGVVRTIDEDNFAEALRWCMDLCIQYVRFRGN
jgi:hypothetical protein